MKLKKYLGFITTFVLTSSLLSFQFSNVNSYSEIEDSAILNLVNSDEKIDHELASLDLLEQKIYNNKLSYESLSETDGPMLAELNVSEDSANKVFSGSDDAPLGIPGFFWGFCLGFIGLLIVYLVMDDSPDRKEQVNNALWGCVAAVALSVVLQLALGIGLWASV